MDVQPVVISSTRNAAGKKARMDKDVVDERRLQTLTTAGEGAIPTDEQFSLWPHQLGLFDEFLTPQESGRFFRIASQTWRINRHYELFRLVQGDVQYFLPHQILVSAWGDFGGEDLTLDVISALPGVRTERPAGCSLKGLMREFHWRWLAHARRPVFLEHGSLENLVHADCACALHRHLCAMRSLTLHGAHNARDGTDSLYLAAGPGSIAGQAGIDFERLCRVIDLLIAQIDVAFRRVTALKFGNISENGRSAANEHLLSQREREILSLISDGRTNLEISEILEISAFTVKNHVQRIIRKLGVGNRTEAVSRYFLQGYDGTENGAGDGAAARVD